MNIQNPYNNVGNYLPPQPFDSARNNLQRVQNTAFPPNRTKEFNIDTSNQSYPSLTPLYYNGDAANNIK